MHIAEAQRTTKYIRFLSSDMQTPLNPSGPLTEYVTRSLARMRLHVSQGLLWREVLEFRDGMPARRHQSSRNTSAEGNDKTKPTPLSLPRISRIGAGSNFNRMVSAFTR